VISHSVVGLADSLSSWPFSAQAAQRFARKKAVRPVYDDSAVGISFFEKSPQESLRDPFSKGNFELEFLGGGASSSLYPGARRPKINFEEGDARRRPDSF